MRKYLTILLFILPLVSRSQEMTYQYADSVTYGLYLRGSWDSLIVAGREAFKNEIDFKYLRERLGYAYFQKGDYILNRKRKIFRSFSASFSYQEKNGSDISEKWKIFPGQMKHMSQKTGNREIPLGRGGDIVGA